MSDQAKNGKDHESKPRGPGGKTAGAPLKKTKPTTVRFRKDLEEFVIRQGELREGGRSAVINDAVEMYRNHIESNGSHIYTSIVGASGHGKPQNS